MSTTPFDESRLDSVFQAALALAREADSSRDWALGPTHLLKYAYLADLAFAEIHGYSFTGVPWIFYKFGPWSEAAQSRLDPAAAQIQAEKLPIQTQHGEKTRYRAPRENLVDKLRRKLPSEIMGSLARDIRSFGSDLPSLLNHTYLTGPMLKAAPGEALVFEAKEVLPPENEAAPEPTPAMKRKERKAKEERQKALRAEFKRRLSLPTREYAVMPEPLFNDIFFEGLAHLDSLAGDPIREGTFGGSVDKEHWRSGFRDARDG